MKKLILFACAAVIAFASCGNKAANAEGDATVDAQAVADSITSVLKGYITEGDTAGLQKALASMQALYGELVESGNLDAAKEYASAIQEFVSENADAITSYTGGNTTVSALVEGIKNLPTSAEATAEDALSAVQEDAKDLASDAVSSATEAASEAVAPVTEKVEEVEGNVEEAKSAAEEKVSQAKAVSDATKTLLGK